MLQTDWLGSTNWQLSDYHGLCDPPTHSRPSCMTWPCSVHEHLPRTTPPQHRAYEVTSQVSNRGLTSAAIRSMALGHGIDTRIAARSGHVGGVSTPYTVALCLKSLCIGHHCSEWCLAPCPVCVSFKHTPVGPIVAYVDAGTPSASLCFQLMTFGIPFLPPIWTRLEWSASALQGRPSISGWRCRILRTGKGRVLGGRQA